MVRSRLAAELNHAAIALSLAACTGAALSSMFAEPDHLFDTEAPVGTVCAATTALFAYIWARLLRAKRFSGHAPMWILSIPFAAANAGCAAATLVALTAPRVDVLGVLGVALAAVIAGFFIWLPALVLTLVLYGVPIALAVSKAIKGVGGADRGERTLGLLTSLYATGALVFLGLQPHRTLDEIAVSLLAVLSVLVGSTATVISHRRVAHRVRALDAIREGSVEGYRVTEGLDGRRILVHESAQTNAYRDTQRVSEIAELDEHGDVRGASIAARVH